MADWLQLDKTSGKGPSEVKVTAVANDTGEVREAKYKVTNEKTGEELSFTCRQESVPIVVIPEFDYLVLRYAWDSGMDFDTATGFVNTGLSDVDDKFVGWSKQYQTTQERVGDYLIHGGDNMESGNEAVLIQMGVLLDGGNYDKLPTEILVDVYGNWYGSPGDGKATIKFTAYRGGVMNKNGYDFTNVGGEEVYNGEAIATITASGEDNWQDIKNRYSKVGTVVYNKETRDCIVRIGQ